MRMDIFSDPSFAEGVIIETVKSWIIVLLVLYIVVQWILKN